LETDIVSSYSGLMNFMELNNADANMQKEALLLGSRLFDYLEEEGSFNLPIEKKQNILAEAFEMIDTLVQTPVSDESILANKTLNQLRDHFLKISSDDVVFSAENLNKKYKNFSLQDISLELRTGEITSVVGENGNGKSTLLKIVAGQILPTGGKYSYPMFDEKGNDWIKIKRHLGYVPQSITPWRNINSLKKQLQFYAAIKGIRGKKNDEAVDYILTRLGIWKYADSKYSALSGGYQLRFELAKQLIWSPKLLVLDEPLANLDIKAQHLLLNDLRNLSNSIKNPMAVLISSQNLYDIENISDKVIYMSNGKDIYNGPTESISDFSGCHCYLVDVECSVLELQKAFDSFSDKIFEIKDDYPNKIIFTKNDIKANVFLSALINAEIKINHFRDISNSTRIFFENAQSFKKNMA